MTAPGAVSTGPEVLGHALWALGQHMRTHGLPEPLGYELPGRNSDYAGIGIHVSSYAGPAWVASLGDAIDVPTHTSPLARLGIADRHLVETDGRLPDSGVRIRIRWVHVTRRAAS